MGISIKNEEVERMLRQYAADEGLSMTDALRQALHRASEIKRYEDSKAARKAAFEAIKAIRDKGYQSDRDWTRDELYDR
jgi:hypothetical protein